jgi:hypothetical protein
LNLDLRRCRVTHACTFHKARSITIESPTEILGDSINGIKAVACSMMDGDISKIEDVVSRNLDVFLFRKTEEEIATDIRPNEAVRV